METAVADEINLTDEQRQLKRSPRGSRTLLDYKLGWSRTILRTIGSIRKIAPATWEITDKGRSTTKADIDNYLERGMERLKRSSQNGS